MSQLLKSDRADVMRRSMADKSRCRCVFPSPTEQELATIPGEQPGTALRVHVEGGRDGYVRLEQLAHDERLGWYVQKSFVVPGDVLPALLPQLRKADCLITPCRTPRDPKPQRGL